MSDRWLRIGVDAHVIGRRQTGNERFLTNLVGAMRALSPHELFLYFTDEGAASDWSRRGDARTTVRLLGRRNPFVRIPVSLPLSARRDRVDVLLVHYNAPPFASCPVVTVVHDVAFARYPEYYSRFDRAWMPRTIPASMRRAAAVVTVSEFSRDEIRTLYGISAAKISVAHDGVDPLFSDPTPRSCAVDPPFFLAVGNLQPRKNFATLLRAFRLLVDSNPELEERLVIAGKPAFGAAEIHAAGEDLRREGRVVFTGYVPDEELAGLLQNATAFAYPSVYEGFGLPVVEAMAAGVPTLASDIPVMREVAADAALLVPATDPRAWAEGLRRVSADGSLRAGLVERGRARAARYTWEECARVVLATLERVARPAGG